MMAALAGMMLWWSAEWLERRPLDPQGGLWWPARQVLSVPHFSQDDPRWGEDLLGATSDSLARVGCAVASAAMVLAHYGVDTDPGKLNAFLTEKEGGFTPQGWIYWEMAPLLDARMAAGLLPHYEDLPSYALMDANLLRGNPVIVRVRYPNGVTHFVVVVGKEGFDYLILDPGPDAGNQVRKLRDFGSPIEALRFYKAGGM